MKFYWKELTVLGLSYYYLWTIPGQSRPAVNDRFLSYLTRFICAVLRPVFVVPYTVSNCRKSPENRVSDRLRSFTIRWNTAVILRIWNESNTTRKRPERTVHVTFFDGYVGRNHCPGRSLSLTISITIVWRAAIHFYFSNLWDRSICVLL